MLRLTIVNSSNKLSKNTSQDWGEEQTWESEPWVERRQQGDGLQNRLLTQVNKPENPAWVSKLCRDRWEPFQQFHTVGRKVSELCSTLYCYSYDMGHFAGNAAEFWPQILSHDSQCTWISVPVWAYVCKRSRSSLGAGYRLFILTALSLRNGCCRENLNLRGSSSLVLV